MAYIDEDYVCPECGAPALIRHSPTEVAEALDAVGHITEMDCSRDPNHLPPQPKGDLLT